jgi:2-polyprenyl-3-methyl-5-hydroxy-6-metoxy-1,4-benzoquinol methylase
MMGNEGIRTTEVNACQLCGEKGEILYARKRDALFGVSGYWNLGRCPSCRLVWLNPRPVPDEVRNLYKNYYTHDQARPRDRKRGFLARLKVFCLRSGLESRWGYGSSAAKGSRRGAGRLLLCFPFMKDRIGRQVMWQKKQEGNELLDVGCGDGSFLVAMRDLGWKVTGVEPDAEAANRAKLDHGIDVLPVPFERSNLPDGRFDVITAGSVLEHVPDAPAFLREAKRLLKPGGKIIVLTPNPESLGHGLFGRHWFALDPPRHFFLYPPCTLRRMAVQAGLRVEELRTTAVEARVNLQASRRLQRGRGAQPAENRWMAGWLSWESYAFYFLESFLCLVAPLGETTLLIARNPQRIGRG